MKKQYGKYSRGIIVLFALTMLMLNDSCTKPTLVGAEILPPEDNINVSFTDTITLNTTTIQGDTVRTYSPNSTLQLAGHLIGRLVDPLLGISKATAYSQLRLFTTSPNFENATLDSVVLSLAYSNTGHYGVTTNPQNIYVSRVTEIMDPSVDYYSNRQFATSTQIGSLENFVHNTTDSVTVIEPIGDSTTTQLLSPRLRLKLSEEFGNLLLLSDSASLATTTNFLDFFRGIQIKGGDHDDAMFRYDLNNSSIRLYYTSIDSLFDSDDVFERLDTVARTFDFIINSFAVKTSYFEHNHQETVIGGNQTAAPIASYLNSGNPSDSITFVQSMDGLMTKIDIPYSTSLNNIIVNKAELVVTVLDTTNTDLFPLTNQLIMLEKVGDNLAVIEDIIVAASVASSVSTQFGIFGGTQTETTIDDTPVIQYKMNITGHFQGMIDGFTDETAIYIVTFPRAELADRIVLGGGTHSKFPTKLNLTFTKLE